MGHYGLMSRVLQKRCLNTSIAYANIIGRRKFSVGRFLTTAPYRYLNPIRLMYVIVAFSEDFTTLADAPSTISRAPPVIITNDH